MKPIIKLKAKSPYKWNYNSVGGVVRVRIDSGEDIAHLDELDQKMWTVLSCPVKGLEFEEETLRLLDTDNDGKIRVQEIIAAAKWLTSVIKNKDLILKGDSELPLREINRDDENGAKLYRSACQILKNLGLKKDSISVAETSDCNKIFAETTANGDGIITPSSSEDADVKAAIEACLATLGGVADRSGENGVNEEIIDKFYVALADYASWIDASLADKENVFPYGDDTAAALAACEAVSEKLADYFLRCKLIAFNNDAAGAVDVSVEKIGEISGSSLVPQTDTIATYPIARPDKEGVLPFTGINPAWQGAFATLKSLVLDVDFKGKKGITESEWNATLAKFDAYRAWKAGEKGSEVESLGIDKVRELISAGKKSAIVELINADKALAEEAESIVQVNKLVLLYRDFYKLLRNYVIFSDFYSLNPDEKAIFEVGELYIDQRCCKLCVKVENMGAHADMAGLSGMFLIYCTCTSKVRNETMNIVAVMTDGGIKNLRPGTNAIFYDRSGQDWDAVVTKIVDNPISVRQAFWSPYRKFANFITEKITKSAAEKESKSVASLQKAADEAPAAVAGDAAPKKAPFDIAKFAGIFAAIGMAIGYIGAFCTSLLGGLKTTPLWQTLLIILGIMLCISGPSMFLAWLKLRKRNLGPVLNANGWAINSVVLVNIPFGATLTSTAKYPKVRLKDPFKKKVPVWKKILCWLIVAGIAVFAFCYFTDRLGCIGLQRHKDAAPEVVETVVEEQAAAPQAEDAQPADTLVVANQ